MFALNKAEEVMEVILVGCDERKWKWWHLEVMHGARGESAADVVVVVQPLHHKRAEEVVV